MAKKNKTKNTPAQTPDVAPDNWIRWVFKGVARARRKIWNNIDKIFVVGLAIGAGIKLKREFNSAGGLQVGDNSIVPSLAEIPAQVPVIPLLPTSSDAIVEFNREDLFEQLSPPPSQSPKRTYDHTGKGIVLSQPSINDVRALNLKVHDKETNKLYVCEDFAWAIATKSAKPSEFNSQSAIQQHPFFRSKLSQVPPIQSGQIKLSYYFDIRDLATPLLEISRSLSVARQQTRVVFSTTVHAMTFIITLHQGGQYFIQFYDPNLTNVFASDVLCDSLECIKQLTIRHFMPKSHVDHYFTEKYCALDVVETIRSNAVHQHRHLDGLRKGISPKAIFHFSAHNGDVDKIEEVLPRMLAKTASASVDHKILQPQSRALSESVIFTAMGRKGDANLIRTYMRIVFNSRLSLNQQEMLLRPKYQDGRSGIYRSMQLGYAGNVDVFLDMIENSSLTTKQKQRLFSLRNQIDSMPGLTYAMRQGHAETVVVFARHVLDSSSFSRKAKKKLLIAKTKEGNSALMYGLSHGQADAVSAFMQALLRSSRLNNRSKERIYLYSVNWRSTLDFALDKGFMQVVVTFSRIILTSELTDDFKLRFAQTLLLVGNELDLSIVQSALQRGGLDALVYLSRCLMVSSHLQRPVSLAPGSTDGTLVQPGFWQRVSQVLELEFPDFLQQNKRAAIKGWIKKHSVDRTPAELQKQCGIYKEIASPLIKRDDSAIKLEQPENAVVAGQALTR